MSWYLGQSWLIILLSILLGLLIGWAVWRRPWHKRYFGESEAITRMTGEHSRNLADKDAEITRLQGLLDERGAAVTAVGAQGAVADAVVDDGANRGEAAEQADQKATDEATAAAERATETAETRLPVETAESVGVQGVQTPEVDLDDAPTEGVDLADIEAAQVDVSDDATATAQVGGLGGDSATPTELAGVWPRPRALPTARAATTVRGRTRASRTTWSASRESVRGSPAP